VDQLLDFLEVLGILSPQFFQGLSIQFSGFLNFLVFEISPNEVVNDVELSLICKGEEFLSKFQSLSSEFLGHFVDLLVEECTTDVSEERNKLVEVQ
jgi:hypothetical protein